MSKTHLESRTGKHSQDHMHHHRWSGKGYFLFYFIFPASAVSSRSCHDLLTWASNFHLHTRSFWNPVRRGTNWIKLLHEDTWLYLMLWVWLFLAHLDIISCQKNLCFDENAKIPRFLSCCRYSCSLVQWWQLISRYDCFSSELVKMDKEMLWFPKTY